MKQLVKIEKTLYDHSDCDETEFHGVELPLDVKSLSFSYDGGRISICVNDEVIYSTLGGSNDCNITITVQK